MSDAAERHAAFVARLRRAAAAPAPILDAFARVPRHVFLPGVPLDVVYDDDAIVTHDEDGVPTSSSSQPSLMARMVEQLDVRPGAARARGRRGHRLQRRGARALGAAVTTVELQPEVAAAARANLRDAGVETADAAAPGVVRVVAGDGATPPPGPYDRMIVTAGLLVAPGGARRRARGRRHARRAAAAQRRRAADRAAPRRRRAARRRRDPVRVHADARRGRRAPVALAARRRRHARSPTPTSASRAAAASTGCWPRPAATPATRSGSARTSPPSTRCCGSGWTATRSSPCCAPASAAPAGRSRSTSCPPRCSCSRSPPGSITSRRPRCTAARGRCAPARRAPRPGGRPGRPARGSWSCRVEPATDRVAGACPRGTATARRSRCAAPTAGRWPTPARAPSRPSRRRAGCRCSRGSAGSRRARRSAARRGCLAPVSSRATRVPELAAERLERLEQLAPGTAAARLRHDVHALDLARVVVEPLAARRRRPRARPPTATRAAAGRRELLGRAAATALPYIALDLGDHRRDRARRRPGRCPRRRAPRGSQRLGQLDPDGAAASRGARRRSCTARPPCGACAPRSPRASSG